MAGRIHWSLEQTLGVVTLSNPRRLGAMTRSMWRELRRVFVAIQADATLRCVLVRGEAGAFCAGGDISEYPHFRFDPASLAEFHEGDVWGALGAMLACDVPVVAQIEGACMGTGVEIASCCDIRVAGESARFGAPIARLGFPMAPREAQVVAQAAGLATAREMLYEAAVFDAHEMKARGFLNRVLPDDLVAADARARCERICSFAPQAARLNKRTLRAAAAGQILEGAYDYAPADEHREGIAAFLDKRQANF